MNNIDLTESTDSDGIECSICLDSLINAYYATTDNDADQNAKCCIKCIKDHINKNGKSLISRENVQSYTIYDMYGTIIQQIIINENEHGVNFHQIPTVKYKPKPSAPPFQPEPPVPIIPSVAQYHNQFRQEQQDQLQQQLEQLRQQFQDDFDQRRIYNLQIDHRWNIRKRISTIICGIIWMTFLVLFAVFLAQTNTIAYVMLGISSGALILGIINYGIMDCCRVNKHVY